MDTSNILATIGVSILLIAFILQNLKAIDSAGFVYLILNLTGAAIAGYASWIISFFPFVILESVWVLVALYGLIKLFLSKQRVSRETPLNKQ